MSKSKKTDQAEHRSAARLREAREARTNADAALAETRAKYPKSGGAYNPIAELAKLDAEGAALKATDELAAAETERDAILHAEELAAGDADAEAVDLPTTRADLEALLAEADELERLKVAKLAEARNRIAVAATGARERIAARRQAAGEPAPATIPVVLSPLGSQVLLAETLKALETRIAEGPKVRRNAERIARLEREATQIRVELERAARAKEQDRLDREAVERQQAAAKKAFDEQQRAKWAEQSAKAEAARAEERELAEAHRERERAGAV